MNYTYIQYTVPCCVVGKHVNKSKIKLEISVICMLPGPQKLTEWVAKAAVCEIKLTHDMKNKFLK